MKPGCWLALTICLLCAGCAAMDARDCRGIDWHQLGWRDGSESGISSLDRYEAQCAAQGVKPDAERYSKGWQAGRWDKDHRRF